MKPHARQGVFFQPVLYGRIEQDNPGSDMAYQRLAFGLLKLGAERHHFDAQTQRGKKDFAKSGVIAPRPAEYGRLCAATSRDQAAPSPAVPADENRGTDSADPQTPAPGHPGCGRRCGSGPRYRFWKSAEVLFMCLS
ncbi:hypothetical protein IE989_24570 [Klebsiella pneumoniae]|nr:hypothetical protein [Klebsiella pneumoniae]